MLPSNEQPVSPRHVPHENSRAPLLIVDDEEANRDVLCRRLQRAGYVVESAASAPEALDRIRAQQVDLVLLDIMMPGMSGIELLKLLRATYSPDELPVIMVTALTDRDGVIESLNLGANDYVVKPIDFPVVKARIESQLRRKRADQELRRSEQQYALAAQGVNDGLWQWDFETRRVYYSRRWKEIIGYQEDEIGDSPDEWLNRIHPEDRREVVSQVEPLLKRLEANPPASLDLGASFTPSEQSRWSPAVEYKFASEHRIQHKDGLYRWILCRAGLAYSQVGKPVLLSGSITDTTTNKTLDLLTGLANRTLLMERLQQTLDRTTDDPSTTFALLFIDVDRFKVINDSLGHFVGDQLLTGVGKRLQHALRSGVPNRPDRIPVLERRSDLVARLGGDEFVLLLENIRSGEDAAAVAARLLEVLRKPFVLQNKEVLATVSIGIAVGSDEYRRAEEVLRDADTAMYRAKTLGRDRVVIFDATMHKSAMLRLELEQDLRRALERDQLVLFYQPLMTLRDEKLAGFEALLRWQHPTRGLVGPSEFIPIAEDCGLIVPIGNWVLRQAVTTMARWHAVHPTRPPLEISVNVSVRQLFQPDFIDHVAAVLRETKLPPSSLQLELTESVILDDGASSSAILNRLKSLGVGLNVDDFGTGYSSLKYLQDYPFSSLKIDRAFVLRLGQDEQSSEVVNTILNLASTMALEVVAEGIETEHQLAYLKGAGCRLGQGFYFSKPIPELEAEAYLVTSAAIPASLAGSGADSEPLREHLG